MDAFNYYLTCRSPSCQEGKKFKVALNKYTDDGSCFLTEKEKKEFSFICLKCCIINSVNFNVIANKETIKLMKSGRITKCGNILSIYSEKRFKELLQELKQLKLQ